MLTLLNIFLFHLETCGFAVLVMSSQLRVEGRVRGVGEEGTDGFTNATCWWKERLIVALKGRFRSTFQHLTTVPVQYYNMNAAYSSWHP